MNSLKAGLTINLYTKKQIILQSDKSENEPIYYDLERCPAMSKYVRLCPKNTAEFLTFEHEDFFAESPLPVSSGHEAHKNYRPMLGIAPDFL